MNNLAGEAAVGAVSRARAVVGSRLNRRGEQLWRIFRSDRARTPAVSFEANLEPASNRPLPRLSPDPQNGHEDQRHAITFHGKVGRVENPGQVNDEIELEIAGGQENCSPSSPLKAPRTWPAARRRGLALNKSSQ